jgi:plasmid stabilization system protein ParE
MALQRELIYKQEFLDELIEIQDYLEIQSVGKGKKFISRIYYFMMDTLEKMPFMFQEYPYKLTEDKVYRRAIFETQYVIIYKITDEQIILLKIYHSSRNPENIVID